MKRLPILFLATACLLLAPACGDDAPDGPSAAPPAADKETRTRDALTALFEDVRAERNEAAAARIVYRGKDRERKWKSVCEYSRDDEKRQVDRFCQRLRGWLGEGEVKFLSFRSKRESEGEWLVWEVEMPGATAFFACLDVGGTIAVGDVDEK